MLNWIGLESSWRLDVYQIKEQKYFKNAIGYLWVSLTSVPAIAWKRERKGFLVYDLGYDPNLGATSYYTILQHNWLRLFLKEHYYLNCTHEFPSKTIIQLIFSPYVKWVKKKRFKKIAFIQSHHPQSSPWVKIQIIGGKVCLSLKGKTLLKPKAIIAGPPKTQQPKNFIFNFSLIILM